MQSSIVDQLSDSSVDFIHNGRSEVFPAILNKEHVKCRSLNFNKTIIRDSLTGFQITGGVHLNSCNLQDGLSVYRIKTGSSKDLTSKTDDSAAFTLRGSQFVNSVLRLENCHFNGPVIINGCHKISAILIHGCRFSSLSISDCKQIGDIEILNSTVTQDIRYENNVILGQIRQSGNSYGGLVMINNTFSRDIFFKDNIVQNHISFNGGIFNDTVTIDAFYEESPDAKATRIITPTGNESTLSFYDCEFKKAVKINYNKQINNKSYFGGCRKIYIGSNKFHYGLFICGSEKIGNKGYQLNELHLNVSNDFEGLVKANNFTIETIVLTGENHRGNISLMDILVSNLDIRNFTNYGSFQLINLTPRKQQDTISTLEIKDSYLEKSFFINCDLSDFNDYLISNSIFSNIRSSNTTWFDFNALYKSHEKRTKQSIKQIKRKNSNYRTENYQNESFLSKTRETFRQLKYAMESQGDRVESLKFKSSELKAFYRLLQLKARWFNGDRLILWAGASNDHGLNWFKPILIYIPFLLLLYVLITVSTCNSLGFHLHMNKESFQMTFNELVHNLPLLPELLNPTHSLEKVIPKSGYSVNLGSGLLDFLSKLLFAFFAFQTVSAFRRFGKN